MTDERLQSVVFFLSDALRSILEDCEALQRSRCVHPAIGPEASCDEIFAQLDDFRHQVHEIRSREAIMVAKLARAREWAQMLRPMAPAVKPETNIFLLGTVFCADLQQAMLPDPQTEFHGGSIGRRVVGDRIRHDDAGPAGGIPVLSPGVTYLIAGKVRIEDVMLACETLLTALDNTFALYEDADIKALEDPIDLDDAIAEVEMEPDYPVPAAKIHQAAVLH